MSKFSAVENEFHNGFQMKFENGWTISVQFGKGNYATIKDGVNISAEIAIWDGEGNWYDFPEDSQQVKGWVNADGVADWIYRVSKW